MKNSKVIEIVRAQCEELDKTVKSLDRALLSVRKAWAAGKSLDDSILEGLAHQIGYINGYIEASRQIMELMTMTDREHARRLKELDENRAYIKKMFDEIKERNSEKK